ncbi:MAG: uroporphyrinogen decarboxylase family protein [Lentisphaerota bacterium]
MDTEQRVLTALRGGQADRVPVFLYLNPWQQQWYNKDPSYAAVLKTCEELEDVLFDWGFPSGLFHTAAKIETEAHDLGNGVQETRLHTPAGPLTTVRGPNWAGGGLIKRWICGPEDIERALSIPYIPQRPDLSPFFSEKRRLAGKAVAQATLADAICSAGWIDETALALMTVESRSLLKHFLDEMFVRVMNDLRYCLEAGVGPIYYFNGPEYALPPLMSPDDFEEFVMAYDTRLIELVHQRPGTVAIVHSHGKVNRFLERFADMGTDALNVIEPPPMGDVVLADAKRRVGDRLCLIGNIQYDFLVRATPDEIDRAVQEAMIQGSPGGGFILSPCASPYEHNISAKTAQNFIRYLQAGRRFGQYPS